MKRRHLKAHVNGPLHILLLTRCMAELAKDVLDMRALVLDAQQKRLSASRS